MANFRETNESIKLIPLFNLLDHYRSQSSRNKLAVQYLLAGMGHGASEGEALSQTAQRELALLAALRQGQPQQQAGPDEGLDQWSGGARTWYGRG